MGPSIERLTTSRVPCQIAAWSMILWTSKGQSCICPSMAVLLYLCGHLRNRRWDGQRSGGVRPKPPSGPIGIVLEDRLHRLAEQPRDAEGERQRRIELARLDGIDALARDAEAHGEFGLAPALFGA